MVVLNRIYTRTGDTGTTALAAGGRRPKYDLRIEAYGTVDETNACLGLVRLHTSGDPLDAILGRIQNDLFDLGADLATVETDKPLPYTPLRITQGQVDRLEHEIDDMNADCRPCGPSCCPVDARFQCRSFLADCSLIFASSTIGLYRCGSFWRCCCREG